MKRWNRIGRKLKSIKSDISSLFSIYKKEKIKNRYKRSLKNLLRNKKVLRKVNELNADMTKMVLELKEKMENVAKVFSELEKEGFSCLKNFQVIGEINFYKDLFDREDDELSLFEKIKRKKWYALDEETNFNHWKLQFDSATNDFTVFSKYLIEYEKNLNYMAPFSFNIGPDSGYFVHMDYFNETLTLFDLAECTIKDFYPSIKVTVNMNQDEIFDFEEKIHHRRKDYQVLSARNYLLDITFDWKNEANINKILEINDGIWKVSNELKANIIKLRDKFVELQKSDKMFKDFDINGEIRYINRTHPTDIADLPLLKMLEKNTYFGTFEMHANANTEDKDIDTWHRKNTNWNFELFRDYLSEEQQKIPFHYFMHAIFIDDRTYSFQDLLRMKTEDFVPCLEIDFGN